MVLTVITRRLCVSGFTVTNRMTMVPQIGKNTELPLTRIIASSLSTAQKTSELETEYQSEIQDILHNYEEKSKRRQALVGTVVSTKNLKSIVVKVARKKYVTKYDKTFNVHKRIMAHDEDENANLGDVVRIVPCRPMSKKKRHALIDILQRYESITDE